MKKNIWYRFLVFFLFVFCLCFGVYVGFKYTKNNENLTDYTETTAEDEKIKNEDTTPVSTKTYDIEVIYKDEYVKCGHVIESKNTIYGTTLEKLKENENKKQKMQGNVYEIEEEGNEKIVYIRKIDQNCPNHFLIKLENDDVVISNIVDESATMEYKRLKIDPQILNPEMLEELNQGIKADSKEDLNLIIEDIES